MNCLFVIPARGGSKGIPGKNIKPLRGKPLIYYSIDYARLFVPDEHICVSTDSEEIATAVEQFGLKVPFRRPAALATDTAGSFEVLQHALKFFVARRHHYDAVVLLQPTSPFRLKRHLEEAMKLFNSTLDMVVSVSPSRLNPYYNLFEETSDGFLIISKGDGQYTRRQDAPEVYGYNGSIYIINTTSLQLQSFREFRRVRKYIMEEKYSIDIDTPDDWALAENIAIDPLA